MLLKNGPTPAEGILRAVEWVLHAARKRILYNSATQVRQVQTPQCVRVVHILAGDNINTNENAAKRVYAFVKQQERMLLIRYSLLAWRCASHKANLIVNVAVCSCYKLAGGGFGRIVRKASTNSALAGTIVRLFKYLVADYAGIVRSRCNIPFPISHYNTKAMFTGRVQG